MSKQKNAIVNLFFAGVGGQGLVLSNQIQARAALLAGFDVKTSDVYGLAMRGGSVYGFNRFGDQVLSSTFAAGLGDILVALEPLEGLRYLPLLRAGGRVVLNTRAVLPSTVLLEKQDYPADPEQLFTQAGLVVDSLDALSLSLQAGNAKMTNVAMLGALSLRLPQIPVSAYTQAIEELVPAKLVAANCQAFELARRE